MEIKENIWDIIEKHDNGDIDKCVYDIEWYMDRNNDVVQYKILTDTDVFDNCGLDIYYISVSWINVLGELKICGSKFENY